MVNCMCADFRPLNRLLKKDNYGLLDSQQMFDTLGNASIFSSVDLTAFFHQLRMAPGNEQYSTLNTPLGTFSMRVAGFGASCLPSAAQRLTEHILRPFLYVLSSA